MLRAILEGPSAFPAHVISMSHHAGWRAAGSTLKEAADVLESAGYIAFKV